MTHRLIPVLFAIFLALPSLATEKEVDLEALDQYIDKAVKDFELPGLAIGIVYENELIFAKGYGVTDVKTKAPVTPNSIFAIASCSKAFTAASLGMLVEDGKIKWDDKVVDYLPEFQLHDPYVTANLTIRDLVCHRAGLATFDGDLLWYQSGYDREEVIRRIRHLPLKNDFRVQFGYQNVMYLVAGEVIEEVMEMTWDEYIDQYVFKPLGMDASTTSIDRLVDDMDLAQPHIDGKRIDVINWDNSGPAASINSNITDLSKWVMMWLNNGKYNDYEMLKSSSIKTLWSTQLPLPVSSFDEVNGTHFKGYAMGWNTMDYSGVKVISHSGGLPGYISKVTLVPEKKLGIIILTNDMTWLPDALNYKVLDTYLTERDRNWAGEFLEYYKAYEKRKEEAEVEKQNSREKNTSPSQKFKDAYTGTFEDNMYGQAKITLNKDELTLSLLPTPVFTGKLEHWHHDTFKVVFEDPFLPAGYVTFNFNSDGKVTSFTIDLPNPDLHFFNLEFKKK